LSFLKCKFYHIKNGIPEIIGKKNPTCSRKSDLIFD
jgi:hypothetical protein